jgi:hypothetical protein
MHLIYIETLNNYFNFIIYLIPGNIKFSYENYESINQLTVVYVKFS